MTNNNSQDKKIYDLEERTLRFAQGIILFCQKLPDGIINNKLIGQLISSSSSVGANYREANEALSKKDFVHRMRITRKECKESTYWLTLLRVHNQSFGEEINRFDQESLELRKIFTAIINKSE